MAGEKIDFDEAGAQNNKADEGSRRIRSTIEFPYNDLDDAMKVVLAMHENAMECSTDQLAGFLDQSPTGGAFRVRLSAARTFGLVETERGGTVRLTPLGKRSADPNQEKAARAEAFLAVPLYEAIYQKFKGYSLPPAKALEREMESFGVSPKQTARARQAFDRSAAQAGYFQHGNARLIPPVIQDSGPGTKPIEPLGDEKKDKYRSSGSGGGGDDLHPFIRGLLDELPIPKSNWPESERVEWLQAAEHLFKLIYKGDDGTIRIEFQPQPQDRSNGEEEAA